MDEEKPCTIKQLADSLLFFDLTPEKFVKLSQAEVNKMYWDKMRRIHSDRNPCNPFANEASQDVTCAKPILDYWIAHKSELEKGKKQKPSNCQHAPTEHPSSHCSSRQPPGKPRHPTRQSPRHPPSQTSRHQSQFINKPCWYGTGCTIKPDGRCKYLHFSLEPCKNGPDCEYKQSKICVYNH